MHLCFHHPWVWVGIKNAPLSSNTGSGGAVLPVESKATQCLKQALESSHPDLYEPSLHKLIHSMKL